MADESNVQVIEATTPEVVAPPKKRRGPQPKKVPSEAAAGAPVTVGEKPARGRKKAEAKPSEASVGSVAKTKAKAVGKNTVAKQAKAVPAPVAEDIADLLQLEQENARLRKALSEKLRAENADLRKRLGLA